jgi:arylsulfatase
VARHPKGTDFDADQWELYHLDDDFAELNDLAAAEPDRLRKMIEFWWSEAGRYGVSFRSMIAIGSGQRNVSG